uniref:Nucleolar and coiled-body phosphoprotein 1-like isoform X2 n=1 Tax=Phascolarctos cinereus TaxID=38626 RepID=A0A6P5JUE2_PHACI|nr:nucleolar and coiled-body phosphoprotein 1-like isoform X2 [Phascolarctos cinereus]
MQSPNSTLGYRASFAEEAKVISEQLQGHGGTDISTIEAELPPPDLTSSASFLDLPTSNQIQVQPSDSPLPPPVLDPKQEPSSAPPSDQGLLFLKGLPALEEAASPDDPVRWQLNVTMELCSLSPDAVQAGDPCSLAPQPSTELNKTCLLSSGTPLAEAAQPECSQAPDDGASGEGALLKVQDLSDTPINKTFLFSRATFVTSTPHEASEGLKLLKGASLFSFPESPQAQEAPSVAEAAQPSARRPQRPRVATGSPPKATPKSGPLGKMGQEKRSLGGASLAVSRRGHQALPLPGQKRWSAVPFRTSGLPVLFKSRREPLASPGARQQKGRSSEAGRMKEAEPPAKAGNNPPSAVKVSQLLHSKSVPPRFSVHQRGPSARDPKSRDPQAARILKPLPSNQGTQSRVPARTVPCAAEASGRPQKPTSCHAVP